MGIRVRINHEAELPELISRYPCFSFLQGMDITRDSHHQWKTTDQHWGYYGKKTYGIQVMFVGKTGYGKSTTLNRIVGKKVFDTSDVSACTKDLYNTMYRIDKSVPSFFILSDLPGVGESHYADDQYYKWYREMLERSQVVVYLLRADQRDYAVDEMIFSNLFVGEEKKKVILAINYADKIEPVNRGEGITKEQKSSLSQKVREVSPIFGIPQKDILYYSAADEYHLEELMKKIAQKVKMIEQCS